MRHFAIDYYWKSYSDTYYERAARCGHETQQCIESAMGNWWNMSRIDELKSIMCQAHTHCEDK